MILFWTTFCEIMALLVIAAILFWAARRTADDNKREGEDATD